MTHVLHLTAWHPCIDGYSGSFVLEQCAALRSAGAQVGLIFSRIEGLRSIKADRAVKGLPGFVSQSDPVSTFGFKSWVVPGLQRFVPRFNQRMLPKLYGRYVNCNGRPDILHAHVALETGAAARRISAETGLDYVVTEHSSEILNRNLSLDRMALANAVYMDARCVIAVSEPLAQCILKISPRANVKVVGNLVRNFVFDLKRSKSSKDNKIRITSISSLVKGKRIHNAIDAIAAMPLELKHRVIYNIIGDGSERTSLIRRASAAGIEAYFHGAQSHCNAMEILAQSDLLLHPSSYETFGIVLAEAMAMGIPVIATRCGGPQTIVNEDTGILVAVDDILALTDALTRMSGTLAIWISKSSAISKYSHKHFHEKNVSEKILEIYR